MIISAESNIMQTHFHNGNFTLSITKTRIYCDKRMEKSMGVRVVRENTSPVWL